MIAFEDLPRNYYGVIYADVPLRFKTYNNNTVVAARGTQTKPPTTHYHTMTTEEIMSLPVKDRAAKNCIALLWTSGPFLQISYEIIRRWGFIFKTVAFNWPKADVTRLPVRVPIGQGYWTRAGSEFVLLATRGRPKRLHADVPQVVFAPRRQHSRKPDLYPQIERLAAGPYLELFARQSWPGWDTWGDQTTLFDPSVAEAAQ